MDIRYSAHPEDVKRYTTEELRKEFLIQNLYQPDTVQAVYSHVDRMVVLGIMPVNEALPIDKGIDVWANFGTNFFLERREAGVFNLGGAGWIEADGVKYELGFEDCLYISRSTKSVVFGSSDKDHLHLHQGRQQAPLRQQGKLQRARHQPVHPPRCSGDLPALHGAYPARSGQRVELHAPAHP